MIACYDFARCPPSYDVVAFLAHAELERLRRAEEFIDIHILPGPKEGFRRDSMFPFTTAERIHWRDNVVVPICKLLPSVRSVTVDTDRSVEGWGKGEYHVSLPAIMSALRQNCRPLRAAPIGFGKEDWITFTLREADHHPLRNSKVGEWVNAARELKSRGRNVVVIRDSYYSEVPLMTVPTSGAAARDLICRAAIYASAKLNVGICNGPMWLSIFMDAPTLMLRPTTNEAKGCYDDQFYARWGLPRGSQLPNSPPYQKLVWEDDLCDNIVRAVEEMMNAGS